MSETNPIPDTAETPKRTDAIPDSLHDWGIVPLLRARAELLSGAETTMTDWLQRRHEAILETRQLIASMHFGTELADTLRMQREWVSHSLRRLTADADAYYSGIQHLMDLTPSWFPQDGVAWFQRVAGSRQTPASQAAATRAAGKPLRMANE